MFPHDYRCASDDPAAYAADRLDNPRQSVSMAFAYDYFPDEPIWYWSQKLADSGQSPWIEMTARNADPGKYPLHDRVFVERTTLARYNLAEGSVPILDPNYKGKGAKVDFVALALANIEANRNFAPVLRDLAQLTDEGRNHYLLLAQVAMKAVKEFG